MSKRWFIYLISLMAVVAVGAYFLPQALEWYNALGVVNQMDIYSDLLGSFIVSAMIGMAVGLIIRQLDAVILIVIVGSAMSLHASLPAALMFCTGYLLLFFPTYLIRTRHISWNDQYVERPTVPGNWAIYWLSLMIVVALGSYFSHQVIEWCSNLHQGIQTVIAYLSISATITSIIFAIIIGRLEKNDGAIIATVCVFAVVLLTVLFGIKMIRVPTNIARLAFGASFLISYLIAFFPTYFIKKSREPKVFER
ncbi:hypothetical protein HN670_02935, partial [bacterium]|nr:hypothetical protein [bacterium]